MTGDPPEVGDYPGASGVYEVDSIGSAQLIARLNAGDGFNGREIDAPTSFFAGVAVNPAADDLDTELDRFAQKIEAGAQFAMTQVALRPVVPRAVRWSGSAARPDPAARRRLLRAEPALALRLHNEVPGIVVPEPRAGALRDAGAERPRSGRSSRAS